MGEFTIEGCLDDAGKGLIWMGGGRLDVLARLESPCAIAGAPNRMKHPMTTRKPLRTASRPCSMANPTPAMAKMARATPRVPVSVPTIQLLLAISALEVSGMPLVLSAHGALAI